MINLIDVRNKEGTNSGTDWHFQQNFKIITSLKKSMTPALQNIHRRATVKIYYRTLSNLKNQVADTTFRL